MMIHIKNVCLCRGFAAPVRAVQTESFGLETNFELPPRIPKTDRFERTGRESHRLLFVHSLTKLRNGVSGDAEGPSTLSAAARSPPSAEGSMLISFSLIFLLPFLKSFTGKYGRVYTTCTLIK